MLFGNDDPLDKHANKENFLSKTEENLLEMFNELPQKEKDNFMKAINTRKNELDQLYEEMKAVKERKGKTAS